VASAGFKLKIKHIGIITYDEIERIHAATINVPKKTGTATNLWHCRISELKI
jgi:hypothetical protein